MTADTGWASQPPEDNSRRARGTSGTLNDAANVGGAGGSMTLAGANNLQQSIDTLNTTIENLITSIANASFGQRAASAGTAGQAQTQGNGGGFPGLLSGIFGTPASTTMGDGASASAANVPAANNMAGTNGGGFNMTPPAKQASGGNAGSPRFGGAIAAGGIAAAVGAVGTFGQSQMPGQIALNQLAASTYSMMPAGSTFTEAQSMAQALSVGTNRSALIGPVNTQDASQMAANLQYLGGNPNYNASPLGRAGFTATRGMMVANQDMTASQASQQAMGLYSPNLSAAMMRMGMPTPLQQGTGLPRENLAQFAQSIIGRTGRGTSGYNPSTGAMTTQEFNTLFSANGAGMRNLQMIAAMSQGAINPSDMLTPMRDINNLLGGRGGPAMTATQATNLMNQASYQNPQGAKARSTLMKYGVQPTDIEKLKQNQSQLNVRQGDESQGFTAGLNTATDALAKFNAMLNQILTSTGAAYGVGYAGGAVGTVAGTSHSNFLSGAAGLIAHGGEEGLGFLGIKKLLGKAKTTGSKAANKVADDAGDIAKDAPEAGGGLSDLLGPLAMMLPLLSGQSRSQMHQFAAKKDPGKGGVWNPLNWVGAYANQAATGIEGIFGGGASPLSLKKEWNAVNPSPSPAMGAAAKKKMTVNIGGGAAIGNMPPPGSKPSPEAAQKKKVQQTVSGQARQAVAAAEKERGIKYQWGGETPGVGFDCSGLIQWAYKQAGVNLPRTSQQMWNALQKRSVPMNEVEEGDLVFMAGSDGSPDSPGHVGMMISGTRLIQAPYTGADVQVIGYNEHQWTHAARPAGSMVGVSKVPATGKGGNGSGNAGGNGSGSGNAGGPNWLPSFGGGAGGGLGNFTSEADAVSSALGDTGGSGGGGMGGTPLSQWLNPGGTSGGSSGNSGAGPGGPKIPKNIKPGKTGATTKNLSGNKKIINQAASKYGWGTGALWNALNSLEMGEAGYNNNAQNPGSTAYGMGQFLSTTWAGVGGHKTSDPVLQAEYMMKYIKERYGNPVRAWADWQARSPHWYAEGTDEAKKGLAWVGERGPELVRLSGGQGIISNASSMAALKAAQAKPAQSPWGVPSEMQNAGLGQSKASQNYTTNINIGSNAIQVNMPPGTGGDISQAGATIAKSLVKYLSNENLHSTISRGHKL